MSNKENIQENKSENSSGGEFQFTVNITPNDYNDAPIVPAEDGLLTAPDGSILTPYSLLELSQKSATTQRRQRKKTNDRGGDYIPRPPNPFILFRCWYTAKVHKPGSHDTSEGTLSSLCGTEWANLGTQQRRIFEEAAKIEKLKHAERYPNYRYKPIHKKKQKSNSMDQEDEEDGRPSRSRTKKATSFRGANTSDKSVTPTSVYPLGPQPMFALPPALARHRRSSSVPPLPSEMQFCGNDFSLDPSMRPIELPAVPFLALAGQDIPPPRKSRPSLGWDWTRGMSQVLTETPVFDYAALRTSIPSVPPLPNYRQRTQLPTFQHQQYSLVPPAQSYFANAFAQQESTIQWTNPNPFATGPSTFNSSGQIDGGLPQLGHSDPGTSSSSCSAPSPPPEISPHDPVPSNEHYPASQQIPVQYPNKSEMQPFDLSIFKRDYLAVACDIDYNSNDRQRNLNVFNNLPPNHSSYIPANDSIQRQHQHHLANAPFSTVYDTFNDQTYSRALNTSNIMAGIPAHESELMESFA